MKNLFGILVLFLSLNSLFLFSQTFRHVPSQYSTIQAGLNAAQSGDTVLVQPGTYTENIFWPNVNGIKLIAAGDTSNTIIDGSNLGTVISISSNGNIDSSTVVSGFKITRGKNTARGGGIFLQGSSPMIKNLLIEGNEASNAGGGIFLNNCNFVKIANLIIKDNIVSGISTDLGGGIFCDSTSLSLDHVKIFNNYARISGGIHIVSAPSIKISNSEISNNSTKIYAGGLTLSRVESISLNQVIIHGNISNQEVGGIMLQYCSGNTEIINSRIENNNGQDLSSRAGGIYIGNHSGNISFFNTTIRGNQCSGMDWIASGLHAAQVLGNLVFEGCTIEKNFANGGGVGGASFLSTNKIFINDTKILNNKGIKSGGLYFWEGSNNIDTLIIANSIFFNNKSDNNGGALLLSNLNYARITSSSFIKNSAVRGAAIYTNSSISDGLVTFSTLFENYSSDIGSGFFTGSVIKFDKTNFGNNNRVNHNSDNSQLLDARNSYWGSITGPHHPNQNSAGQGDSVNFSVNILPYLTSPDTNAPPIPVMNFRLTNLSNNEVSFAWDPSQLTDLSFYRIYWDTDSIGHSYGNSQDIGNVSSFTLSNLSAGQKYYFALTCVDNSGNESWFSNEVSATTIPPIYIQNMDSIIFPQTAVNDSALATVVIRSGNISPLTISAVNNSNSVFSAPISLPYTINSNDSLILQVAYKPVAFGQQSDTLKLVTTGGNGTIALTGSSPFPTISANLSVISYGTVTLNTSTQKTLTIRNGSINKLRIDSSKVSLSQFSVLNGSGVISNNDSLVLSVKFTPTEFGVFRDTLIIYNNSNTSKLYIPLSGSTPIQIVLSGGELNFGNVPLQDSLMQELYFVNIFPTPLIIDTIRTYKPQFNVNPKRATIASGDTLKIKVSFYPTSFGVLNDSLSFISADQGRFLSVRLRGTSPYPNFLINSNHLAFDSTNVNTTVSKSVLIKNSSINTLVIDSVRIKGSSFSIQSVSLNQIRRGDSSLVTISFAPNSSGSYSDTIYIYTNSQNVLHKVSVSGIGRVPTNIEDLVGTVPGEFELAQNYPNPFNPVTNIVYALPVSTHVTLEIFSATGQLVITLVNSTQSAGYHQVRFNATSYPSGLYFYRLSTPTKTLNKKMLLLK